MSLNLNIKHNLTLLHISCSVDAYFDYGDNINQTNLFRGDHDLGQVVYVFNDDGPVYGPNGQLELDPDNQQCGGSRPVFATCKNNCPGGELIWFKIN